MTYFFRRLANSLAKRDATNRRLDLIAWKYYKDVNLWWVIAEIHNISNPFEVKTGAAYTLLGGELQTGTDKSASTVKSSQSLQIDGKAVELTAYNIGGNNFFGLRDLGKALNFDVDYDTATATMIVESR